MLHLFMQVKLWWFHWAEQNHAYTSFAVPKENKIKETLEVLLAENEKVKQFGFTQSELDREKKNILARFEQWLMNSDKIRIK